MTDVHVRASSPTPPSPDRGRDQVDLLRGLARAALVINSRVTIDEILQEINGTAADLIQAHQAVTTLIFGGDWSDSISAIHLSDKYEGWRQFRRGDAPPDGSGIYRLVCDQNRPMRLTQEELEAHPAWRGFGEYAEIHPPMRGWLAAPLVGRDGENLGLIQLSDRVDGADFDELDESVLVQLAQMASVAVEKTKLYEKTAAQEAARFRDEIVAGVSHDMQTPLAAIVGFADLLTQDPDLPREDRKEIYGTLSRQARSLRSLVQQFLDFSRLEADRPLVIHPRETDVVAVVEHVVGLFEHEREIVVGVERDLPPATVDPDRLEQVLANLLSNAVKFSQGSIRMVARRDDEQLLIDVVDEGPGIAESDLDGLFDKFHRGRDTGSTRGSGLGLYISRAVMEAQGGRLEVRSQPGAGTRFRVLMPVALT